MATERESGANRQVKLAMHERKRGTLRKRPHSTSHLVAGLPDGRHDLGIDSPKAGSLPKGTGLLRVRAIPQESTDGRSVR
jgi:hypothetical protein